MMAELVFVDNIPCTVVGHYGDYIHYCRIDNDTPGEGTVQERFRIGCGKTDFLYQMNADFRKQLDDAGYPYEYMETEGGHTWRFFDTLNKAERKLNETVYGTAKSN